MQNNKIIKLIMLCATLPVIVSVGVSERVSAAATVTPLYSFPTDQPNTYGQEGLLTDTHGNLYGTTSGPGTVGGAGGGVFEIPSGGTLPLWLHTFPEPGLTGEGFEPQGGVISDDNGNLYGTTILGGSCSLPFGCGTVFKLSPPGCNAAKPTTWCETPIYAFLGGAEGSAYCRPDQ
jgi:uncharacterized repeat protein (TIGR03803 family)